jgi:hypothetical protein
MKKTLLFVLLLGLAACSHKDDERVMGPCGDITNISYRAQVKPIIMAKCVSCHVEYKFYDRLNEDCFNGKFQKHVFIDRDMPPAGGMDTCHYVILRRWFRDGHYN